MEAGVGDQLLERVGSEGWLMRPWTQVEALKTRDAIGRKNMKKSISSKALPDFSQLHFESKAAHVEDVSRQRLMIDGIEFNNGAKR